MILKSMLSEQAMYSPRAQAINQVVALGLIVLVVAALKLNAGTPLAVIVGGSAIVGFFCWRITNLRRPIEPLTITIVFLLTVAALHIHMFEEHGRLFGPAMSRLFHIPFSDARFLEIFVFLLPTIYYLTTIGLMLRIPFAAFVAWFIFIGPGMAELTHFVFPFITPALEPDNAAPISAIINGVHIEDMQNHHMPVSGKYYFPGLYTAILPMIPGIYGVWRLLNGRHPSVPVRHEEQEPIGSIAHP